MIDTADTVEYEVIAGLETRRKIRKKQYLVQFEGDTKEEAILMRNKRGTVQNSLRNLRTCRVRQFGRKGECIRSVTKGSVDVNLYSWW